MEQPMKGGGGGRVGVGEDHDISDGMQCTDHPFRNNPGAICAFCLQEKLGKLVSSSFPLPIHAPSSSSSSPSFRSDRPPSSSATRPSLPPTATSPPAPSSSSSSSSLPHSHYHHYYARRTRLPFLLSKNKKKKPSPNASSHLVLKRSKSTATPRRNHSFLDADHDQDFSPRKRHGFWSFLYLSSKSSKKLNSKSFTESSTNTNINISHPPRISTINSAPGTASVNPKENTSSASSLRTDIVVQQDANNNTGNSPTAHATSSMERKVSRSRSVGCGSRSFSGDFFERISTGFGDCTLRRVESQREGKPKVAGGGAAAVSRGGGDHHHHHCMKERVRCGGLFSGFMMTSSSSSSSSSSYWVSSSADDAANGKSATVALSHNRGRSWGWAFASPMRAFSGKPSSKESNRRDIIRDANDGKNAAPNLSAIPSLLAVRS